jgi:hypothetical protein
MIQGCRYPAAPKVEAVTEEYTADAAVVPDIEGVVIKLGPE